MNKSLDEIQLWILRVSPGNGGVVMQNHEAGTTREIYEMWKKLKKHHPGSLVSIYGDKTYEVVSRIDEDGDVPEDEINHQLRMAEEEDDEAWHRNSDGTIVNNTREED